MLTLTEKGEYEYIPKWNINTELNMDIFTAQGYGASYILHIQGSTQQPGTLQYL